ncbi:2OG-Fe(II)-dependent halogenase WelO5 family protein [Streptomyces mirabilis]|uniref:2OG-Fe(II)-dependent halogenase WelO5 family protein n=1 Tax=Streptomyces mirabilis TaxID=68239 RepID=UPI0036E7EFA0
MSEGKTKGDPFFSTLDVGQTESRRAVQRLAGGTAATVLWPAILDQSLCASLVKKISAARFAPYDEERLSPAILKFGPALYDHYVDGQVTPDYWEKAERAQALWNSTVGDIDPVAIIRERLAKALSIPVRPATYRGRDLFVGILREFPHGSLIHFDEVSREFAGHLDEEPIVQLAFNCHLETAEEGGELTVWRHRWVPSDDEYRQGYGWDDSTVKSASSATVHADVGDAVLFDCRNFHRVGEPRGGRRRITLSFFAGFSMGGELLLWS